MLKWKRTESGAHQTSCRRYRVVRPLGEMGEGRNRWFAYRIDLDEPLSPMGHPNRDAAKAECQKDAARTTCPECACQNDIVQLRWSDGVDTAFEGRLDWWRCPTCREKFVTRNGENPSIAAW